MKLQITIGVEESVNVPLEHRLNAQCSNLQGTDTHNPTEHPQHNTQLILRGENQEQEPIRTNKRKMQTVEERERNQDYFSCNND